MRVRIRVERRAGAREQRRHRTSRGRHRGAQRVEPERIHRAERAQLPTVAPLHRAVDRREIVGERSREGAGVAELFDEEVAEEGAVRARQREHLRESRRRGSPEQRVDLRRREAAHVAILARGPVEGEDRLPGLLIEAGARLVAEPAGRDEVVHEGLEREVLAGGGGEAGTHMHEDIEAGEVTGAEGGRLRASDQGAGQGIHLGDGESVLHHQPRGDDHPVHAEPVGDEARHILRRHDPLAEDTLLEGAHRLEHRR